MDKRITGGLANG
jgi:hypothetical protein